VGAKSLVVKHSVNVDGHKTSITLEEAFWTALKDIAHKRRESLQPLSAASTLIGNLPICHPLFAYLSCGITWINLLDSGKVLSSEKSVFSRPSF
jgi:hypothetical protein